MQLIEGGNNNATSLLATLINMGMRGSYTIERLLSLAERAPLIDCEEADIWRKELAELERECELSNKDWIAQRKAQAA